MISVSLIDRFEAGKEARSPLARLIGAKGYHAKAFSKGPIPWSRRCMTQTCDYLIIGGGSAGCVLARRLANKTRGRIILLEAGKSDENDPGANDLFLLDDQTADYDLGFLVRRSRPPA